MMKSAEKQNAERRLGKAIINRLFQSNVDCSFRSTNPNYNFNAYSAPYSEDLADMKMKMFDLQVAYNILLKHKNWEVINAIFYEMVFLDWGIVNHEEDFKDASPLNEISYFIGGVERLTHLKEVLKDYPKNLTEKYVEEICNDHYLKVEELYAWDLLKYNSSLDILNREAKFEFGSRFESSIGRKG